MDVSVSKKRKLEHTDGKKQDELPETVDKWQIHVGMYCLSKKHLVEVRPVGCAGAQAAMQSVDLTHQQVRDLYQLLGLTRLLPEHFVDKVSLPAKKQPAVVPPNTKSSVDSLRLPF